MYNMKTVIIIAAAFALTITACSFLNPDDPPHPVWGIWTGPYPTILSPVPDSARWILTSFGVYEFFALKKDGSILSREDGFFSTTGIELILSVDRAGTIDPVTLLAEVFGDTLTMSIRGETYLYRRIGTPDDADEFRLTAQRASIGMETSRNE